MYYFIQSSGSQSVLVDPLGSTVSPQGICGYVSVKATLKLLIF